MAAVAEPIMPVDVLSTGASQPEPLLVNTTTATASAQTSPKPGAESIDATGTIETTGTIEIGTLVTRPSMPKPMRTSSTLLSKTGYAYRPQKL